MTRLIVRTDSSALGSPSLDVRLRLAVIALRRAPCRRIAACASAVLAGSLLAAGAASAQSGPPPPPVGTAGNHVSLVARGIVSPAQIAFARGRTLVGSPGDEETGKGGGIYRIQGHRVSRIDKTPVLGVVYTHDTLFGTSQNKVIAWSRWRNGAFTKRKVIFSRPINQLPFLETIAVGPDGRLYMGSSDAGDKGPLATPLSGRVFAMGRDGSGLQELAKGLRQPFGIAFVTGDASPYVGNESDESKPTPPDFLVHAQPGSDFGFPACQWLQASAPGCAGKTAPTALFAPHASPTGMVGRGDTIYTAFFGGTTKSGPEIRALKADGSSKRIVRSAAPLIGVGMHNGRLYFGDVTGAIWSVKV